MGDPWYSKAKTLQCCLAMTCFLFIGSLAAAIALGVLYSRNESPANEQPADVVNKLYSRVNCFPEQQFNSQADWQVTEEMCQKRGCTFEDTYGVAGVPPCYMESNSIGYFVDEVLISRRAEGGNVIFQAKLKPLSSATIFDPPIQTIQITANVQNNQHLHIKIEDYANDRYEVPFPFQAHKSSCKETNRCRETRDSSSLDFEFEITDNPFSFRVLRKASGTVLFDTSMGGFVFSDRFLQISTRLPSRNLYGLGEHDHPSLKHDLNYKTWPMFAKDIPGFGEEISLYGVHPMYMVMENDGNAHGVFLLNSNAMEYALVPAPGIIIRTIGGIFDFHIYTGPSPDNVVQQHTAFVGRPYLPPYWSLGFQISRYGYNNLSNMRDAIERTRKYAIPLDVIYADIDHMDAKKDFTLDESHFGGLPAYLEEERAKNGLHSVIILDPGVANTIDYEPWDVLNGNNTFITWANGSAMMGYVWPNHEVAFPDFFLERTRDTWTDIIKRYSEKMPFDGLWIDMNEPTNLGNNRKKEPNYPSNYPDWFPSCPLEGLDDPPYRTRAASAFDTDSEKIPIFEKTLCMEATQNDNSYKHFDVHSLYGWTQGFATVEALKQTYPTKRPFVLSRSTFAGSGSGVTHWLGDNYSSWKHLHRSIIGMLEMGMFGIPHVGADICGFINPTTTELCKRWSQLGAFYPFSRNHNDINNPPQDPGYFGKEVAGPTRQYLDARYLMLPYMYTLFYKAHINGTTVVRPLFFEFPDDPSTWDIDKQFMIGPYFMIAPILEESATKVQAYLPKGIWNSYDFTDSIFDYCDGGRWHTVELNADGPGVFQRGGSIIAFQHSGVPPIMPIPKRTVISTATSRQNNLFIQVIYDCDNTARGDLFWDDGDSPETISTGRYWLMSYNASMTATDFFFEAKITHNSTDLELAKDLVFDLFLFINIPLEPTGATLYCDDAPCATNMTFQKFSDSKKTATYRIEPGLSFTTQNWSIQGTFN